MRVITGTLKGKRLNTPDGRDVRPTPDRVSEFDAQNSYYTQSQNFDEYENPFL